MNKRAYAERLFMHYMEIAFEGVSLGNDCWEELRSIPNLLIDAAKEELANEALSPSERGEVVGEEE